tara:strand:- start:310 stop:840 length:531 start_codon:yes stop_codon:yes gene_type:complete
MALSKIDAANFLTGTIPQGNVANATLNAVTTLPAGVGGKVLQVVTATDNTQRSTTSSSFVTGSNTLSVDITPSATSSKIFVTTQFTVGTAVDDQHATYTIYRDTTDLGDGSGNGMQRCAAYNVGWDVYFPCAMSILDSPSSTSELTYQVYMKTSTSSGYINYGAGKVSITAYEISG